MIQRKIFPALEEHLGKKTITVITGMRRVGKTSALKYLLDKVSHENKIYLDLEKADNRFIFQHPLYRDVQIDLEIAGISFDKPAVIALDEIQLVPNITSIIKYFHDTWLALKFVVTGSSSFYLKNRFSESLAGRKPDTGILQQLAQVSSGQVFENAIFLQWQKTGTVNYYQKKSGQEIDFVLNQNTAVEVKETPHSRDLAVLKSRAASVGLQETLLAGRFPPNDGFQDFIWGGCIF